MKKLFLYIGIAIIAVSCSKSIDATSQPDIVEKNTPTTIYASIYNNTRSELHWENATTPRTYWSENDKIAVLNGSTEYNVYELAGETNSQGEFTLIDGPDNFIGEVFELDNMIAFYPYTDSNSLIPWKSQDGERKYLTYIASNTQPFVGSNTYGANVNAMIAIAEKNSTENIQFKNIFGYLRVTLKGDEVIKKVILKGNNNEIIAGDIKINLSNINEIVTDGSDQIITIDCGNGVRLTEEGISFIFALPPTEFTNGFTIYAMDSNDDILTLNSQPVTITQNVITPMPAVSTQDKFEATNPITYEAASRIEIDSYSVQNNIISHSYSSGVGQIIILEDELKSGIFNTSSITNITIPVGITSIDNSAFNGCPSLQSVTLPTSLTNIGRMAFNQCTSLKSIDIPEGVNSTLYVAFADCPNLVSATIPGTLNDTYYAFARCANLEVVNMAETSTIVGTGMFSSCQKLKSITLYNNITKIMAKAFSDSGLESITIPDSVKKIYNEAFNDCIGLKTITFQSAEPPMLCISVWNSERQESEDVTIGYSEVFGGDTDITTIYVPAESVEVYKTAWSTVAGKIKAIGSI